MKKKVVSLVAAVGVAAALVIAVAGPAAARANFGAH
jgi:hypothetical protein